jgi:hypothetical protein
MFQWILMTGLYSVGIMIGFFLVPFFTRVPLDEKAGIELDEHFDHLFLSYKFVDEVEDAPMSELTPEELKDLRDKQLNYEIPFLKQPILMYYDHEKESFCYYAQTAIIYKYLMVVARKYVLEFNCKQIFKEMVPSMKKEEKTVHFSAFVAKPGKVLLEKDMNRFHYLGNFPTDKPVLETPKQINYSEYWKMCRLVADLKIEPVTVPETEHNFSSTPEIQSTKSD